MPNVPCRRRLVGVGAAALTVVLRPFPALTDLLDTPFGHLESKATKPITPNCGFRHRMVAWQARLSSCRMLLVVNRC